MGRTNRAEALAQHYAECAEEQQSDYEAIDLSTLRQREREIIAARRQRVGRPGGSGDLVGLALSGGGVRSSMFNIGVLQALDRIGLFRWVDYMATVSGGGFIGGYLTAQFHLSMLEDKNSPPPAEAAFPLAEDQDGQRAPVIQLTRQGGYLNAAAELALRVVLGIAIHVLIVMTLLVVVCSGIAFVWRIPDMSNVQRLGTFLARRLDWPGVQGPAWWLLSGLTLAVLAALASGVYFSPRLFHRGWLDWLRRCCWPAAWTFGVLAIFLIHEGGYSVAYGDWIASSDLIRAFVMLAVACYLLGFLDQLRIVRRQKRRKNGAASPPDGRREEASNPPHGDDDTELTPGGLEDGWLELLHRHRGVLLALFVALSVLTTFANGDTDLGPRLGKLLGQFFPSVSRTVGSLEPFKIKVRNNDSIKTWLQNVTQYLLFIQLLSGVVPLLLPRRFATSAQPESSSISRVIYRSIVFLLFVSLPLVTCYLFLHENISGSISEPLPIQRLGVCQDNATGRSGYLIDHDQGSRLRWFATSLLLLVVLNWLVDLNRTSLHCYYRRRLKASYLSTTTMLRADLDEDDGYRETRLQEIDVRRSGAPYPLISATMSEVRPGSNSLDSGCNFIFSPEYVGWSRSHPPTTSVAATFANSADPSIPPEHRSSYIATRAYSQPSKSTNGLRLVDAMAISGAAISPAQSRSIVDTILLLAANARLGQWMLNPGAKDPKLGKEANAAYRRRLFETALAGARQGIGRISPYQLIRGMAEPRISTRSLCFLSDGAHYDNLGLELLFERQCRLIVASDVSHDPDYYFADLVKVLRRLRVTWGIDFFLDPARIHQDAPDCPVPDWVSNLDLMTMSDFRIAQKKEEPRGNPAPAATVLCRRHALHIPFRYPTTHPTGAGRWGLLIVLKPSLIGNEDLCSPGLFSYARANRGFPMDPDMRQSFDESQCEYYRELGYQVGLSIGTRSGRPIDAATATLDDLLYKLVDAMEQETIAPHRGAAAQGRTAAAENGSALHSILERQDTGLPESRDSVLTACSRIEGSHHASQ